MASTPPHRAYNAENKHNPIVPSALRTAEKIGKRSDSTHPRLHQIQAGQKHLQIVTLGNTLAMKTLWARTKSRIPHMLRLASLKAPFTDDPSMRNPAPLAKSVCSGIEGRLGMF